MFSEIPLSHPPSLPPSIPPAFPPMIVSSLPRLRPSVHARAHTHGHAYARTREHTHTDTHTDTHTRARARTHTHTHTHTHTVLGRHRRAHRAAGPDRLPAPSVPRAHTHAHAHAHTALGENYRWPPAVPFRFPLSCSREIRFLAPDSPESWLDSELSPPTLARAGRGASTPSVQREAAGRGRDPRMPHGGENGEKNSGRNG